jgi:hypothetical protein
MRDEIWAGMKNAIERGESLEGAAQSFINAGYNAHEVQEAAESIRGASGVVAGKQTQGAAQKSSGASANLPKVEFAKQQEEPSAEKLSAEAGKGTVVYVPTGRNPSELSAMAQTYPSQPSNIKPRDPNYIPFDGAKSTRKKRIIILMVFLLILVALLILAVIYSEKILDFINELVA